MIPLAHGVKQTLNCIFANFCFVTVCVEMHLSFSGWWCQQSWWQTLGDRARVLVSQKGFTDISALLLMITRGRRNIWEECRWQIYCVKTKIPADTFIKAVFNLSDSTAKPYLYLAAFCHQFAIYAFFFWLMSCAFRVFSALLCIWLLFVCVIACW